MYCENKNHLLDLYYLEGNEAEHKEMRGHVAVCIDCRNYLELLAQTITVLDKIEDRKPADGIFDKILSEVSVSVPRPAVQKSVSHVIPILQIAFGQIFLFSLIYILNLKLTLSPLWKNIKDGWLVQLIGSAGIAVIIVLAVGTFVTLSIAPILLFESKEKKSFS